MNSVIIALAVFFCVASWNNVNTSAVPKSSEGDTILGGFNLYKATHDQADFGDGDKKHAFLDADGEGDDPKEIVEGVEDGEEGDIVNDITPDEKKEDFQERRLREFASLKYKNGSVVTY
nr:D-rich short acidic peptide [Pseudoips prasinana]